MGKREVLIISITGGLAIVAFFAIFQLRTPTEEPNGEIVIGATIFPLADIAQHVGGDYVEIIQLLPPGSSPHSFTLAPNQIANLQGAKLIFTIGHGLDPWAAEKVSSALGVPTVPVDKNINLRPFTDEHEEEASDHEDGLDPHYWITFENGMHITQTIATVLATLDPEHADEYQANADAYIAQLMQAEQELQSLAATAPQKHFIAVHNGWGYLQDAYGFETIATFEPVEGTEPSIADIRALQDAVKQYGITTFYTEPQKKTSSSTHFIEDDMGLEIRVLDPIGGTGNLTSYISVVQNNVRALAQP